MDKINSVTVYCGSSVGASDIYQQQAIALASDGPFPVETQQTHKTLCSH
ncbi:hypothetical protein [Arsenophonus sp. ENCA]|nr:hypothetical protein [Arsenophonus sp. ENCA]